MCIRDSAEGSDEQLTLPGYSKGFNRDGGGDDNIVPFSAPKSTEIPKADNDDPLALELDNEVLDVDVELTDIQKSGTSGSIAAPPSAAQNARFQGYTGDPCPECGHFTLIRNGTCQKCDSCGTTTGCS